MSFLSINFFLILSNCLIGFSLSDIIGFGKCPNVTIHRNFKYREFSGEWFEIAKNPMYLLGNSRCNKINIKINRSSYSITVKYISTSFNKEVVFDASALPEDTKSPAKLTIEYPLSLFQTTIKLPYWILHTDYQTALLWSCTEHLNLIRLEYFWVLSRKPYLNDLKLKEITDILRQYNVDTTNVIKNDMVGCM